MFRKSSRSVQRPSRCSGNLRAVCSDLPDVPEIFLQLAATFPTFRKSSCNLQQPSRCSGNLPAVCSDLSDVPETFLHCAATFPTFRKPSRSLQQAVNQCFKVLWEKGLFHALFTVEKSRLPKKAALGKKNNFGENNLCLLMIHCKPSLNEIPKHKGRRT